MDEDDGGLGAIEFSDSEIEADPVKKKNARTDQTEQDFQLVKDTYSAKVENGEIYKTLQLPLQAGANKQHVQEVLHAAEELYFFQKFERCIKFIEDVLQGSKEALGDDTARLLERYLGRCKEKLEAAKN